MGGCGQGNRSMTNQGGEIQEANMILEQNRIQSQKALHSETIGRIIQYAVSFARFQPDALRGAMIEAKTTTDRANVRQDRQKAGVSR